MRAVIRTAAAVTVVVAATPFAHANAAPSPLRWRLWQITRANPAAGPLDMTVAVTPASANSLAFVVGLRGTGAARRVVTSLFWERGGSGQSAYHDGTVTPLCPSGCDRGPGGEVQLTIGRNEPTRDEYLALTWAAGARTTFTTKGWRVREVAATPVRRILASSANASGVQADGRAVEHYSGAAAVGGARGSVAWASLPCDVVGQGTGDLTAKPTLAIPPPTLACPDATERVAVTNRAVTWTVTADAIGVAADVPVTRLLVVDVPK